VEIEYVTHASLRLTSGGRTLLTDPFYWLDPLPAACMNHFPPRELALEHFGRIDYLHSSHLHPDHSHPATLRALRDKVGTALLPAGRAELVERYRGLGYERVVLLENGRTLVLDEGLRVTCWWSDAVDTCLVVEMDGITVLHLNDCLPEAETVRAMAARHRIDYAFVLYTSAQELYPFLLPYPLAELERLGRAREEAFLVDQLARIEALDPRFVVPYSMTMTSFDVALNGLGRLTPPLFAARVGRRPCLVVQPGDVIEGESARIRPVRDENLWGETIEEYLANVSRAVPPTPFDPGLVAGLDEKLAAVLKAFLRSRPDGEMAAYMPALAKGVLLRVEGRDGTRAWHVCHEAGTLREVRGAGPFALVEMTIPASHLRALLDGEYDPYSLLFLYKMRFRLHRAKLDPETECALYVAAVMLLLSDSWRTWMHFKS
jgi:UDP-MurNAc hydroxylase